MKKIIIVSNRLPVTVSVTKDNNVKFTASAGGLATGLDSVFKKKDCLWIGWPGFHQEKIKKETSEITSKLAEQNMAPIFLNQEEVELFYEGFSNNTIWPLFHYFPNYSHFDEQEWEAYRKVNQLFCEEIVKNATDETTIWIHDYHLLLLPSMVREKLPNAKIAYFQHIPFPSYETFRILPCREEVLKGLISCDLIGFHTFDDVKHFLTSVSRILGLDNKMGEIRKASRCLYVDAFPMGIDYIKFEKAAETKRTQKEVATYCKQFEDTKVILSIDRLDYSKGIPERLKAFNYFLEKNPDYIEKVSLMMIVAPSRENVHMYQKLKMEIDELVGNINAKYRTMNWSPVLYFYRSFPFQSLSAFYKIADIALITPLRDGMNLVCKEYIASRTDKTGVLILSEMAGASKELPEALIINPCNINETAEAIKTALKMPHDEQVRRMEEMQDILKKYDVHNWVKVFMKKLDDVLERQNVMEMKQMNHKNQTKILDHYVKAEKRILFLDYDGTLVSFANRPEFAKPDAELYDLLNRLSQKENTKVVLISGRDKHTMEKWFGHLELDIVAEHGVWKRKDTKEWILNIHETDEWKKSILPLMEIFVNRTPGAIIEEKSHSLAWHYRRVDPDLADIRTRELMDHLQYLTTNMPLSVMEGKRVIEVKSSVLNKGTAATEWLADGYDFILAAGDDWTDEDMFKAMPESAYTLKIGFSPSVAKYNIKSCGEDACNEMRDLLKAMLEKKIIQVEPIIK